jgi:ribonuclease P protein component
MTSGRPPLRSLRAASFPTALSAPRVATGPHFVLQHAAPKLSTETAPDGAPPVDEFGCVVPKRLARRAVTRNLIRRQLREAMRCQPLERGLWLVRLRGAFDPGRYRSAASDALRTAVREEVERLLAQAAGRRR